MHVSSQPYLKTYLFPLFSLGTAVRLVVLILAVVLPFFMTYSTPSTLQHMARLLSDFSPADLQAIHRLQLQIPHRDNNSFIEISLY